MVEPVRMCIGCRGREPKASLVRLVWDDVLGRVVVDHAAVRPGRGAYVHPGCVDKALRSRAVTRQLRLKDGSGTQWVADLRSTDEGSVPGSA